MALNPETLAHRKDSELLREFQGLAVDAANTGAITLRFATVSGQFASIAEDDLPVYLRECEALLSERTGDRFRQSQLTHGRKTLVWGEFQALKLADLKLQKLHLDLAHEQAARRECETILRDVMAPTPARAARLMAIAQGWKTAKPQS